MRLGLHRDPVEEYHKSCAGETLKQKDSHNWKEDLKLLELVDACKRRAGPDGSLQLN